MNCVSCDICAHHLRFVLCYFPGIFLSSRMTGACTVTTDLILRVKSTHDAYENTWKCGELKLYFSPSAGG